MTTTNDDDGDDASYFASVDAVAINEIFISRRRRRRAWEDEMYCTSLGVDVSFGGRGSIVSMFSTNVCRCVSLEK